MRRRPTCGGCLTPGPTLRGRYYVGHRLAGQRVALAVVANERALDVYHGDVLLKRLPLRGLRGGNPAV
jgi:hypothetical protein